MTIALAGAAEAEERDFTREVTADTVSDAVRVTIVKSGGRYGVQAVSGGGSGAQQGCTWSVVLAPELAAAPYGSSAGPMSR